MRLEYACAVGGKKHVPFFERERWNSVTRHIIAEIESVQRLKHPPLTTRLRHILYLHPGVAGKVRWMAGLSI